MHCSVVCSSFSHTASLPPGLHLFYSFSVCTVQFIFHHNSSFWLLSIFLRCGVCLSESRPLVCLSLSNPQWDGYCPKQNQCRSWEHPVVADCAVLGSLLQEKVRPWIQVWERKLPHAFPRNICIYIYILYIVFSHVLHKTRVADVSPADALQSRTQQLSLFSVFKLDFITGEWNHHYQQTVLNCKFNSSQYKEMLKVSLALHSLGLIRHCKQARGKPLLL